MAVIGLKPALTSAVLALALTPGLRADQATDIRRELSQVANELTAGNPADALTPFSKAFRDYGKLSDYFTGLTGAFAITNEVDVLQEQDTEAEATLTVQWTLSLSDQQSNLTTRREATVHVRMVLEKKKWRIADFTPISLFDPAEAQKPTPPPGS